MHKLISEKTGGSPDIREKGLLESALAAPFQTFAGIELYPTLLEKGAMLGYSLVSNHAFVDGNKRIGVYVMLTFLEAEGIKINCTNQDVVHLGLSVASGDMKFEDILNWINKFKK